MKPARKWAAVLACMASAIAAPARGQGGPPLLTDDPETPGNGRWEINLGMTDQRARGEANQELPIADFNYGWGEHVQLKAEMPWAARSGPVGGRTSGPGRTRLGAKWRFADEEQAGLALSVYPQVGVTLAAISVRRELAPNGIDLFLPLEAARHLGAYAIGAEIGRRFARSVREDAAGLIVGRKLGEGTELLGELRLIRSPDVRESVLNIGLRRQLSQHTVLLLSAGRGRLKAEDAARERLLYLGVQFLR